jgi:hypothetical protein
MGDTPPGWIPDSGLDAHSVASMTPDEAKEYLTLVIRYVAPSELAWLRRAIAARRENAVRQLQDLLRRAPGSL